MSSRPGESQVLNLIRAGEIEAVLADPELAALLMDDALRHLDSADQVADYDAAGGFQMVYDAARKACAVVECCATSMRCVGAARMRSTHKKRAMPSMLAKCATPCPRLKQSSPMQRASCRTSSRGEAGQSR